MLCFGLGLVALQHQFSFIEFTLQMRHLLTKRDKDIPCLLGIGNGLGFVRYVLEKEDAQVS